MNLVKRIVNCIFCIPFVTNSRRQFRLDAVVKISFIRHHLFEVYLPYLDTSVLPSIYQHFIDVRSKCSAWECLWLLLTCWAALTGSNWSRTRAPPPDDHPQRRDRSASVEFLLFNYFTNKQVFILACYLMLEKRLSNICSDYSYFNNLII